MILVLDILIVILLSQGIMDHHITSFIENNIPQVGTVFADYYDTGSSENNAPEELKILPAVPTADGPENEIPFYDSASAARCRLTLFRQYE